MEFNNNTIDNEKECGSQNHCINQPPTVFPSNKSNEYLFKLIIIGSSNCGKSSILQQFVFNKFDEKYNCTIGVSFLMKTLIINNHKVKLQLWDTAGMERFKSLTSSYYKGANAVITTFDLTNRESFLSVPDWLANYRKNCSREASKNIVLIGNKLDKQYEREVTVNEAKNFADANQLPYFETSAKYAKNINEAFYFIAQILLTMYQNNKRNIVEKEVNSNNEVLLKENFSTIRISDESQRKKKCCNSF